MPLTIDSTGCLYREDLPEECINDCSHPGPCDADARHWRQRLGFAVNREDAIRALKEYGAWDADELAAKRDEELAEIVLWLACGDLKDDSLFCLFG